MEVQETIAFIGGAGKNCPVLMKKMAQGNLRLLFLYNGEDKLPEFVKQLKSELFEEAEIDIVDCVKDGCWEADVIAFVEPEAIKCDLLEKIKEVATQKILLLISNEDNENSSSYECHMADLEKELPHSRIVGLEVDSARMIAVLSAKDPDAIQSVKGIMKKAGYETEVLQK